MKFVYREGNQVIQREAVHVEYMRKHKNGSERQATIALKAREVRAVLSPGRRIIVWGAYTVAFEV